MIWPLIRRGLPLWMAPLLGLACGQSRSGQQEAGAPAGAERPAAAAPLAAQEAALLALRSEESALRRATDYRAAPDARDVLGPDPVALEVCASNCFVGLLANPGALVLLDARLQEHERLELPAGASALATPDGVTYFVGHKHSSELRAFVVKGSGPPSGSAARHGRLSRAGGRDKEHFATHGVRALVARGRCLYGADEQASELAYSCGQGAKEASGRIALGAPPVAVAVSDRHVVVSSVLGHRATIFPLAASGQPLEKKALTFDIDGPLFAAAVLSADGGDDYVALGGLEDHPLDRSGGSFGHVDSFVYVQRLRAGRLEHLASFNVGELGVVTPKALLLERARGALRLTVTGYGSAAGIESWLPLEPIAETNLPTTRAFHTIPGITRLARTPSGGLAAASPLLDAFVMIDDADQVAAVPALRVSRTTGALAVQEPTLRLGEALFYTTAMGPWQRTDGALSRFTCETCHFEGGIDGRVHATGRGAVTATTKPLFGLANNAPHFTRALDADLTEMVFAEFRVASANSGHDEWFDLEDAALGWVADAPWLAAAAHDAPGLRRALMMYLANLPHPRKASGPRSRLTPLESEGADLFDKRCATCHAPRLVASDPSTFVPRKAWDALVLSAQSPIVWASADYRATGVIPYVHAHGARTSSLRRIASKTPLFTNGQAKTLVEALSLARFDDASFAHSGEPATTMSRFDPAEIRALLAFLELL